MTAIPTSSADLSACELRAALVSRELSAREVMQDYLARIDARNDSLNAIVSRVPAEQALAAADAADTALAEGAAGALTGFPLAVKDLADVEGLPTRHGTTLFGERPAAVDSLLAARLRAAGGCFIGKTNTPEFGLGSHTFNPVFGLTRNPYRLDRSAGGSSGGAACALAAHLLPVADGSDFGGSLRNPGSFCGVVGLRPSVGCVANVPLHGWMARIGVQGPMGRNVADTALLLSVLAGHDPRDPLSYPQDSTRFEQLTPLDLAGLRIAWSADLDAYPVEHAVVDACQPALTMLTDLGARVEATHPNVQGAMDAFQTQRCAALRSLAETLERTHPNWREQVKDTAVWNFEQALSLDFAAYHAAEAERTRIAQAFARFFEQHDFLVLPTVQVLPFPADEPWVRAINGTPMRTYLDWMSSCCIISITDLPALSLPVGFADGLPVGLQIVGPPKGDLEVLRGGRRAGIGPGLSPGCPAAPAGGRLTGARFMSTIVNLGSLTIDHVYRVRELAGAGETIAAADYRTYPGGKGLNQSLAAARAGAAVRHAGCVGQDAALLLETLQQAGVDLSQVQTVAEPTGHAMIQVNERGQNAIVISGGANRALSRAYIDSVLATVSAADWLLLQNEINDLPYVLKRAAERKLRVAFNIAPPDERVPDYPLEGVALFVLNGHEARSLAGDLSAGANDADVRARLAERFPRADLVITHGSEGLNYRQSGTSGYEHLPALRVDAVDETAAGDAFTGYLLAELAAGTPLAPAVRLASAAGAVAVTAAGAASSHSFRAAVDALLAD